MADEQVTRIRVEDHRDADGSSAGTLSIPLKVTEDRTDSRATVEVRIPITRRDGDRQLRS